MSAGADGAGGTPDRQGQLQGANSSVQSVSQMLGPFLFTLTFAYFIGASARAADAAQRAMSAFTRVFGALWRC